MPRGSPELTQKRKDEIIDACARVYKEQGFWGVNIKEISSEVSMTRPAIYNYFETKEEILLGLLVREYKNWTEELKEIEKTGNRDIGSLAETIAATLGEKDVLLRILNMNLFEIEINSRVERLAEFKLAFKIEVEILHNILRCLKKEITDEECNIFCNNFNSFLFGVYPFTHHTQKQNEAMKLIGIDPVEPTIYEMVKEYLRRAFAGIQD